jgi:hypothetical protein
MKYLQNILLAMILLTFFTACEKEEDNANETETRSTLSAKWLVENSNIYKSFEFNESGNYIIEKHAFGLNDLLFGNYEVIDDKNISLDNFGTISINEINENTIDFTVKLTEEPENEVIINATKKEELQSSTKTDLLCRTWQMITENGVSVKGTEDELTVLFSQAGTYFVTFLNRPEEVIDGVEYTDGGLAQWRWRNTEENRISYSWDLDDLVNWEEQGFADILELTKDKLVISEYGDVWELRPATNTKSVTITASANVEGSSNIKSGIFKK